MGATQPSRHSDLDHGDRRVKRLTPEALRDQIAARLAAFRFIESTASLTPAAVALAIVEGRDGEPAVPIFQRPTRMRRHAGQMALPGGKRHTGETAYECALRELDEELGLRLGPDALLGRLDDFDTRSGFTITPVVVWGGANVRQIKPSRNEVARLFLVRLATLRAAVAEAAPGHSPEFSLGLPGVRVYAPTAAMLFQFDQVALQGASVRVADFYQPPWTHR